MMGRTGVMGLYLVARCIISRLIHSYPFLSFSWMREVREGYGDKKIVGYINIL